MLYHVSVICTKKYVMKCRVIMLEGARAESAVKFVVTHTSS
ncbi:hypothetical protein KGM_212554 [Danaus plexippus plexippus]|uniref:Uncharacterized protein n=1 Tax=Danaus plexippus plexippus TaxID=278856 RepID=A0A212ES70_DANPL|nr:hypothetical protein KGM_212554 [Danaus plexippus plexippus]